MKICKKCGESNPNDATYCTKCGNSEFVNDEQITCAHCGAVNDKSFTHCVNCGNRLGTPPQTSTETPSVSAMAGSGAVNLRSASSEVTQCPSCGAEISLTAMFCNKCGTNVAAVNEHRVVQRKICPHCGRPNAMEAHMCSNCFCSLSDARTENLQVVHDHRALDDGAVRQVYLESSSGKCIVCPGCGALNATDEDFCVNCGIKLYVDEPKKYCKDCGAENAADAMFCSKCNHPFEGHVAGTTEKWTCRYCGCDNDIEDAFCCTCGHKRKK